MKKDNLKKIISIGTLKGGVGKTGVGFNLGGILAEMGNKVLMIDLDPQANTTADFGIVLTPEQNSSSNMFINQKAPTLIVQKDKIKGLPGLDLMPSTILLTKTDMQLVASAGREMILLNYIKQYFDWFKDYDYIIIDTNPSMSVINQNAFVLADDILLVTEPATNSYAGAQVFIELWEEIASAINMKNNISGIIINKVDLREKTAKEFIEFAKSDASSTHSLFLNTFIPINVSIKEANELENVPINMYKKQSKGYIAMMEIVNELIDRGVIKNEQ